MLPEHYDQKIFHLSDNQDREPTHKNYLTILHVLHSKIFLLLKYTQQARIN